jgi:F-type H+-transporting ATPase subunit delta
MKDTVAARKYAQALFAKAQSSNQLLACQQGLEEISRRIAERDSLRRILIQPFIASAEKQQLIHSALGEYATPLLERFLGLLVQKRRFDLLPVITELFQEEVDRSQNVQALHVRTAFPMSEAERATLQHKLEGWLKAKVRMDVVVEPELIGGVVVQTRDQIIDDSLRTQLRKLEKAMLS